jgi:hypothetical protein
MAEIWLVWICLFTDPVQKREKQWPDDNFIFDRFRAKYLVSLYQWIHDERPQYRLFLDNLKIAS